MQRTLTSGATPQTGRSGKLLINAGKKMEKSGILQYVAHFEGLLVLVNRRLPGGDLLIKIPDGDPTQTIMKLDRQRPNRHQERWSCSADARRLGVRTPANGQDSCGRLCVLASRAGAPRGVDDTHVVRTSSDGFRGGVFQLATDSRRGERRCAQTIHHGQAPGTHSST